MQTIIARVAGLSCRTVGFDLFMPILWLRVALCCYAVGLTYALLALTRTSSLLNRVALPAMSLGMVFQFVSLTEAVVSLA